MKLLKLILRRLLEIVLVNCRLDVVALVTSIGKLFDVLAEGLHSEKSRGDKTPLELFVSGVTSWPRALVLAAEPLMANSAA
jgi:hypothetical protein